MFEDLETFGEPLPDFRVIIAGSRYWDDFDLLTKRCDSVLRDVVHRYNIEIVSGCARGADRLGERYAKLRGYRIARFPALWDEHGRGAGFIRNKQMAEYADALIAFPLGKSSGTRHMIRTAKELGMPVRYGTNPQATTVS